MALKLKKVQEPSLRQALLEEAKVGLSLRDLRARIRETLRPVDPPTPYRELLRRMARLDLQGLPRKQRGQVEHHLQASAQQLGTSSLAKTTRKGKLDPAGEVTRSHES